MSTAPRVARAEAAPLPPSPWVEIGRSWLSMKAWVKIWLFFLNFVLLGALWFLRDPIGIWTTVAYAAAGPLLFAITRAQRGLTRLLGLAHFIPWIPLVLYLDLRLTSELAGPPVTMHGDPTLFVYALVVLATVGICLALDVYDVSRWLRGERFVLGSEEAYRAGASGRARV